MPEDSQQPIRKLLDEFADQVRAKLDALGLPAHASPLWQPWNQYVVLDAAKVTVAFTALVGGPAVSNWIVAQNRDMSPEQLAEMVRQQTGETVTAVAVLPLPVSAGRAEAVQRAASRHAQEVERSARLTRLGDLTGVSHLAPYLREFLNDHPNPERNVFVMMRFHESLQLDEALGAIKDTLGERGYHAVRADERDYTGELWSNIEVYLTGCHLGIALFEDIEKRDFNPNVSLELGYMMGRRKRCLILKEKRLPDLPADVVHRLYKPFDMFDIRNSVSREVARWIDVDLGGNRSL